jgi:hypothetical protein
LGFKLPLLSKFAQIPGIEAVETLYQPYPFDDRPGTIAKTVSKTAGKAYPNGGIGH